MLILFFSTVPISSPLPSTYEPIESHTPKSVNLDIVFKKNNKYSEGVRFDYTPGPPPDSNESFWNVVHDLEQKILKYGHNFGGVFNKYE